MSNTLINRIVTLSGPMPDETRFRRYLATLNGRQLAEREAALLEPTRKEKNAAIHFGGQPRPARPPVTVQPRKNERTEALCF